MAMLSRTGMYILAIIGAFSGISLIMSDSNYMSLKELPVHKAQDVCNKVWFVKSIYSGYIPDSNIVLEIRSWLCSKGKCIVESGDKGPGHGIIFKERIRDSIYYDGIYFNNLNGDNIFILKRNRTYTLELFFVGRLYSDDDRILKSAVIDTSNGNIRIKGNLMYASNIQAKFLIETFDVSNKNKHVINMGSDARLVVISICKTYTVAKKIY